MNLPEVSKQDGLAIDAVVSVINQTKDRIGFRQNLMELARSRNAVAMSVKVPLPKLCQPFAQSCDKLLDDIIEKKWQLTPTFMFHKRYLGISQDESTKYYNYEVVFSQPTISYPVPQATVSVYFRLEDKLLGKKSLCMYFRIEGHHVDHDVRYILLTPDWLLAVIKMKIKLFQKLESLMLM